MDETTRKILEIVTDIQDGMGELTTKADLEAVRQDLQAQITVATNTIAANTKAIAELTEQMRGVFDYAKEIDMLMTRMAAVEKQLGIVK